MVATELAIPTQITPTQPLSNELSVTQTPEVDPRRQEQNALFSIIGIGQIAFVELKGLAQSLSPSERQKALIEYLEREGKHAMISKSHYVNVKPPSLRSDALEFENQLKEEVKRGKEAFYKIFDQHTAWIKLVTGKSYNAHIKDYYEFDDVKAWVTEGFMEALARFDHTTGVLFATYAHSRMRGKIIDELRLANPFNHHLVSRGNLIKKTKQDIEEEDRQNPNIKPDQAMDERIAQRLGFTVEQVRETKAQLAVITLSIEDYNPRNPASDDEQEEGRTFDLPDEDKTIDPQTMLLENELRERLVTAIDKLSDRHKLLLALYYEQELTMKEISIVFGVSESRVCQIHLQMLNKLKASLGDYLADELTFEARGNGKAEKPEEIVIFEDKTEQSAAPSFEEISTILTQRQKEVFSLRKKGMSVSNIANQLGISKNAVRVRLIKVKQKIKKFPWHH